MLTPLHRRGWFDLPGLAQWWEPSPSNSGAWVRFHDLVSCGLSLLVLCSGRFFSRYVLRFSPLTRNHHLICCDSVWFVVRDWKVRLPLLHLVIGWENIAPVIQPMRSKTKTQTNHTFWAQFFPRFEQVSGNSWEFLIGSSRCLPLLWLVGLITLVLVCKSTLHWKKNPNWQETDRVEPGTIQLLVRVGLELTIYRLHCLHFWPRVMLKLMRKRRGHFIMTFTKIRSNLID